MVQKTKCVLVQMLHFFEEEYDELQTLVRTYQYGSRSSGEQSV